MKADRKLLAAPLALILASTAAAGEKEELLKLKNTTLNLIDILVQQGIIDKSKAEEMIKQAETKAEAEARAEAAKEARVAATRGGPGKGKPGPIRVTYVPDFVKDEIRAEVSKELRDEVVKEVKSQAKTEKWGVPAALPDWVNRFKLSGDFRVRFENQLFADDNQEGSYLNWPVINEEGGITAAGESAFLNTTVDRQRYRIRFRLGLEAQIAEHFKAGVRLATSNDRSPISINQTLGQYGKQYEVALDRAFLQYDYVDDKGRDWFTVWAGRFANPWLSTDNMFDPDLSFEGFAGTFRLPIGPKTALAENYFKSGPQYRQINMGSSVPNAVFLTLGAFPLQEIELESQDKWLWAAQTGLDWHFGSSTRMKAGIAYYDYKNIVALPNALGSRRNDWTAPAFFTKGNSLARISNDPSDTNVNTRLVGLASDFDIIDAMLALDYGGFGANHIMLTANFSENIGFDRKEILRRTGLDIKPKTTAFQVRLDVGRPEIRKFGDWSTFFAYKYLERDSVLDAFTDSNFHLAGTDAKGWMAGMVYGLAKNTWANIRWLSADEIDGPPLGIDVLLVDLNARF
ncbi:putative porin [Methylocaldum marinum]|nr:putative porin [Methylocaldum marinum]